MSVYRQICRVIESEAVNRKIIIELNGKLLKTEKILGLDFRTGDYACFQTFIGTDKSLVVPLNSEELKEIKNKKMQKISTGNFFNVEDSLGRIIPADGDLKALKYFDLDFSDFSKSLNKELIKDPFVMSRIEIIFDDLTTEENVDSSLRDVFPVIAVQTSEEFQELKKNVYIKADEMLCRKLVYEQSNRDVHQYLINKIDNIINENDHENFFKSLGFYLDRLKKIQLEKKFSSTEMGTIIYPVYSHYTNRFNREKIDTWIQSRSKKSKF